MSEWTKEQLQLRLDGVYLTREGHRVKITSRRSLVAVYPWGAECGTPFSPHTNWYTDSGRYGVRTDGGHHLDLVSEVLPESSRTPEFDWAKFEAGISSSTNICAGAKADIRKAIQDASGLPAATKLRSGAIYALANGASYYIAVVTETAAYPENTTWILQGIDGTNTRWRSPTTEDKYSNWIYVAPSAAEYFRLKAEGKLPV